MRAFKLSLLLLVLCTPTFLLAQEIASPTNVLVSMQVADGNGEAIGQALLESEDDFDFSQYDFEYVLFVTIDDPEKIDALELVLNSNEKRFEAVKKTISLSSPRFAADGTQFRMEGNTAVIHLGKMKGLNQFSAEVNSVDAEGNRSKPTLYTHR